MFNLLQQTNISSNTAMTTTTTTTKTSPPDQHHHQLAMSHSINKLPSFLANHQHHHHHHPNQANVYNFNTSSVYNPYQHQIFANGQQPQQQQHQYQFQKSYTSIIPITPSVKWHPTPLPSQNESIIVLSPPNNPQATSFVLNENSDDHFNRHIENLNKNDDENTSLICEEQEELNEVKLTQLINLNKKNKKSGDIASASIDGERVAEAVVVVVDTKGTTSTNAVDISLNKEETDEDYFSTVNNDEQPKVFQDEDVDLHPTLNEKTTHDLATKIDELKSSTSLATAAPISGSSLEIRQVFSSSSSQVVMLQSSSTLASSTTTTTTTSSTSAALTTSNLNAHQLNMADAAPNTLSNPIDSIMPTPLAYSRSSSLTSLNSFDVKSVHSEVASEYSHYPCLNKNKGKRKNLEKIISDNSAEDDDNDNDDDDDTQEEDNGEDIAEKESKTFYHHYQNKKDNDDTQNDEDEYDDFDKLMPESPAAPADSSFVMQQRIKHKQLQMHCREKAAATMHHLPLSNETTTTTTTGYNFLEQTKSWQIHNTDLNAIMSKLSTLNCNANVSSKATTPNAYSHSSPQAQLVMPLQATFSNNANNNTPPVKLLSAPKFVQNMSQPVTSAASSVPPIVAANPPMSVTYAFMKNSQINRIPVVATNSLSPSTTTAIAISQPTSLSTTSVPSQTITSLNHQPKFLMSSNHHYPIYNTTSINHSNPPPPPTPIIKISPLSTTTTTIAPSKSPQAVLDELPSVFSTETRLNHNRYVTNTTNYVGQDNNVIGISQPSSPPESVCSRMSDTSIPSIIRQDINLNKNKFQNILNKSNQSYSNNNVAQQAPANDFKALFSKLSTNKTIQQIQQPQQQQQLPSFYQYQNSNQKLSPKYKFNNHMTYFAQEQTNESNETYYRNLNSDTYEYDSTKQFLSEGNSSDLSNNTNNTNIMVMTNNSNFNPIKPAFLNSYKFMSSNAVNVNTKEAHATNINSTNTSILYSPKVFNHEGTNSRYSSASSLDQDEANARQYNESFNNCNKEENNDVEGEEDTANLTNNNLNITTKPMNTPAGLGCISATSLIDSQEDEEEEEGEKNGSKRNSNNKLTNKSSNNLELGILDLENFISELYAPSTTGSPAKVEPNETNTNKSEIEVNKKKILKRSSLQSIISNTSSFSSSSSTSSSASISALATTDSVSSLKSNNNFKFQSHKRLSINNDRTGAVINLVHTATSTKIQQENQQIIVKAKPTMSSNIPTTLQRNQTALKLTKKPSESSIETNGNKLLEKPPTMTKFKSNPPNNTSISSSNPINNSFRNLSNSKSNIPNVNKTKSSQLRASKPMTSSVANTSSIKKKVHATNNVPSQIPPSARPQQPIISKLSTENNARRKSFGLETKSSSSSIPPLKKEKPSQPTINATHPTRSNLTSISKSATKPSANANANSVNTATKSGNTNSNKQVCGKVSSLNQKNFSTAFK